MQALFQSTNISEIFLFRHGETEWTISGKHTGLTDIDLTENGKQEAIALGKTINVDEFDHVFCSPLKRVRETCRLAGFKDDKVMIEDGLLEWDYGKYEGITSKVIHETNPTWTIFSQDPPGGEKAADVKVRVVKMFEKISRLEGKIALVGSGHINRVIGSVWIGMEPSFGQHLLLSTGSKCCLSFEHGYRVIKTWNAISR